MKQSWALLTILIIGGLCAAPGAFAAADWEWSRDKGWSQGMGQAKSTPDEQLKYAWSLEKDGRYMNAAKQYFLLLKTFPDSEEAGIGLQRLANCLFLMENYYDSYRALEQVIKTYPLSAKKSYLIKLEFLIGQKFQNGARRDLLNDKEPPAVGLNAAVEIFKSVIDNDPVGPYAGAATLAIGYCYKDLGEIPMAVVYTDRVLSEFSMSTALVTKARILKQTLEVLQGKAGVDSVKVAVKQATDLAKEEKEKKVKSGEAVQPPAEDVAQANDYDKDIKELEETQAKKLWDAAEFYKNRGSRDSVGAYKFSLEQIIVRFPNTSYAEQARRVIGTVKLPPKENSFGKFNLPIIREKPATFAVQQNTDNHVDVLNVPVPGSGDGPDAPAANASAAGVNPATPATFHTAPKPAQPAEGSTAGKNSKNNKTKNAKGDNAPAAPKPIAAAAEDNAQNTPPQSGSNSATPAGQNRKNTVSSAPRQMTPPGESGAGIRPSGMGNRPASASRPAASSAFAATPAASAPASLPSRSADEAVSPIASEPVRGDAAGAVPPDSGVSSAIPAAIRNAGRPVSATPSRRQPPTSVAAPARTIESIPEVSSGQGDSAATSTAPAPAPVREAEPEIAAPQPRSVPATAQPMELPEPAPLPVPQTETSPQAQPVPDPQMKVVEEKADSNARTKANDAAAQKNKWEFSEEFK